jgi:signal transduction histidine kinase
VGEPFVSHEGTGRGLGVLNVKKMVEVVHGGVVKVESAVGSGTRVTVAVPRKQSSAGARSRKARRRDLE